MSPSVKKSQRHLFLDPAFLRQAENAALHVNPPRKSEIVIRPDQPHENAKITAYLSVVEEGRKLRMWYTCRDRENQANVAYAESGDGVRWEKPPLGLVDYRGSKDNNLVGLARIEGSVFRDPRAASANEKYVYVASSFSEGLVRFFSPDGLRWSRDARPLLPFRADTQNVAFWDARINRYVLYLRGWTGIAPRDAPAENRAACFRKVVRLTAEKLSAPLPVAPSGLGIDPNLPKARSRIVNEMPTVLAADAGDPPNSDVYNLPAQPYPPDPRWYVGFPSFFQRERDFNDGRLEVQFAGSNDGIAWQRYDRRAYVAPGLAGSESANMAFMGVGLIMRGDEIWQYGTGFRFRHGDSEALKHDRDGAIYRYVQRLDGFVSLDFGAAAGRCLTAPVEISGACLRLNADTGALGQIRVGLLDGGGRPVAGFSAADCGIIRANATGVVVAWQGKSSLAALQGRMAQLEFTGSRAKLYSFRFDRMPP